MGYKAQTTDLVLVTDFQKGQARSSHPGFSQTEDKLPPADKVWNNFFTNVLRGDSDGPWYGQAGLTISLDSRTFSDPSPTGAEPPNITSTEIDGVTVGTAGAGDPDGGFVPTVASPGEVPGAVNVNYSSIPALNGNAVTILESMGAGTSTNGLILSPADTADCQTAKDGAQTGVSPFYGIGMYAWSGDKTS